MNKKMTDYYKVLGVTEKSSSEEIKKAYRNLCKIHHPDVGGTEEKIKEINEAYGILSDPVKKAAYDSSKQFGNFGQGFGGFQGNGFGNFDDLINNFFANANRHSNFSGDYDPFKRGRDSQGFYEQLDINLIIEVDLEHIYKNEKVHISYKRNIICTTCDGTGTDLNDEGSECVVCSQTGIHNGTRCRFCRGTGTIHIKKCGKCKGEKVVEKEERIPVDAIFSFKGERIQIAQGYGHFSKYYTDFAKKGNLKITLIEKENPDFQRGSNNVDLRKTVNVDFRTAISGGQIKFSHIDGKEYAVDIPQKMQTGQGLKLKDKGLLINPLTNTRGSLILTVNIVVDYDKLSEEQINKIKTL